ncbi:MAG: dihydroorotate dehydrogenase electron transfer subunit [Coriobacteriia bacterium]|nr:dihydroorotate dehydrogenase electron transfer subunit [Coriobacteriia bacterium]
MCKHTKYVCQAHIAANDLVAPDTYALILDVSVGTKFAEAIQSGQFIELNLRQPDLVLPRPISIFATRRDNNCIQLEFRYQVVGEGTQRLSTMPVGAKLEIFGPLGNRWPIDAGTQRALVVGGGIGSAPLAMLVKELAAKGCEVTMVQGARSAELLADADFFEVCCDSHCTATDDGSRGHTGLITEPLAEILASESFDVAYICGPEPMQEACARLCIAAGVPTWVSLERLMACGVGACLTCVVPTISGLQRVCSDGPIFNAREVDWDEARSSRVH